MAGFFLGALLHALQMSNLAVGLLPHMLVFPPSSLPLMAMEGGA